MSKERTDEFLHWRGLVDQPDARLDQVLDDKEATWQKLAERLGERRRNRLSGYRIAAACLLFALIIPAVRFFQDRHGVAGAPGRHHPEQQLSPVATSVARRPHAATATTDAGGGPRVVGGEARSAAATTSGGRATVVGGEATTTAATTSGRAATGPARRTNRNHLPLLATLRVPPALIVAAPLDSANQSLLPPPSQGPWQGVRPALRTKELKVVHQNEIRGGNMPLPSVGAASSDRFINILLRTSRSQPASAPPPTEDPALLKIKLSPSN